MSIETSRVKDVLVLLSGGQDSTTCLWWVKRECPEARIHALTVTYGQRHVAEVHAARAIAALAGCATWDHVDLSQALGGGQSALTNPSVELKASGGFVDAEMPEGLPTSFVPGRNLVFLSVAASWAANYRCQWLVTGVCQTDYSGYPDCRQDFVEAMEEAVQLALPTELNGLSVMAPLLDATKAETVTLAVKIGDPMLWRALGMSVTCYHGLNPGCGECPACALRDKGFREAGIPDPQGKATVVAGSRPEYAAADRSRAVASAESNPYAMSEVELISASRGPVERERRPDVKKVIEVKSHVEPIVVTMKDGAVTLAAQSMRMTLRQAGDALAAFAAELGEKVPMFDHLTLRVDPVEPDGGPSHGDRVFRFEAGEGSVTQAAPVASVHERPTLDLSYDDIGEMVK